MGKLIQAHSQSRAHSTESIVTVHIGHSSCQDYPSKLKGMWRMAYLAKLP